jgi:hypothetical protein
MIASFVKTGALAHQNKSQTVFRPIDKPYANRQCFGYVRRAGNARPLKSEKQMVQEFLDQDFVATDVRRRMYCLQATAEYKLMTSLTTYPGKHPKEVGRQILAQIVARPCSRMRDVLEGMKLDASFQFLNNLRLQLTTNAFPFLRSQGK